VGIPQLRARINAKESKSRLRLAELHRLGADCDAAAQDMLLAKGVATSTFAQLGALSASLQSTNTAMKASLDASQSARLQIEGLRRQLRQVNITGPEKVARKRAEVEEIPKRIKVESNEKVALLAKRRVLVERLERKLEEVRTELVERQSTHPALQELTHQLEREWVEHQQLFDAFERTEAKMHSIQSDLDRTDTAIREFAARWPTQGKRKTTKGFDQLVYTYEEALLQNRQMAFDHAALTEEIAVLEEMNATLCAAAFP
jgi:chromosome segregation ATPase